MKYEKLKEVENRINELCLLRQLKTEAEHRKRIKCIKTLRLYIKIHSDKDGTFIRIDSRVLNDFKNSVNAKMGDLIDKVTILVNHGTSSDPEIYEWTNHFDESESFEIRSSLSYESIKLILTLSNKREIFKLSPTLSSLLLIYTSTKPNLLGSLYTYIIKNNLMIRNDHTVKCNEDLSKIFGTDEFKYTDLPEMVNDHLLVLDDIEIEIVKSVTNNLYIYDIPVEVDDLYQHPKIHSKDVYHLERKIDTINEIKKNLIKRKDILEEFCINPINFINKWICLELEEWSNKTSFFKDEYVQELMYELLKGVV